MSEIIRVLIADDHVLVRKGMRALLATVADIEVAGEAGNGSEAVAQFETLHPDVTLMDIEMPGVDGVEAIRRIIALDPQAHILVLTSFATNDKVFPAIRAGALGYLLKDSEPDDLIEAIRRVHHGEPSLHPVIARQVLQEIASPAQQPPTRDPLTAREVTVLRHVAQGLSNQEIAERLQISETTVRTHVTRVLNKLHIASRTQAALYALKEGLASLDNFTS